MVLKLASKFLSTSLELALSRRDAELLQLCGAELETSEPQVTVFSSRSAEAPPPITSGTAGHWFEELLDIRQLELTEAPAAAGVAGTGEAPGSSASTASHDFANSPNTLLMVSTSSLKEFGRLCGLAIPGDRFRANLEVDFKEPYEEAAWPVGLPLHIGDQAIFEAAGRCVRCQAVDIDPEDAAATGPSILAALATVQSGDGTGPTFGVLLRPCQDSAEIRMLRVGMPVSTSLSA